MPKKRNNKLIILQEQQVLLSKQRTILSFMRTGLAFIVAGIAIVSFFQTFGPAQIVGYILVGIGFTEIFECIRRLLMKQREMEKLKDHLRS